MIAKVATKDEPMAMGKVGKAMASPAESGDIGDEDEETDGDELMAFKAFKGAATPEKGLAAFKNLLKMCGGY